MLLPLALAALLVFFLFNSRRKQKARMEQIKNDLVPGAKVMTTFGVFGTVVSIDTDNNQVTIESGPGTVLRVHRQAIGQIDNPESAPAVAEDIEPAEAEDAASPAITDAELDAMNARKRAEGGEESVDDSVTAEVDAKDDSTEVSESADDSSTTADDSVADSNDAKSDLTDADTASSDDADADSVDVNKADADKADTDTADTATSGDDKKN